MMPLTKETVLTYATQYDTRMRDKTDKQVETALQQWFKQNRYLDLETFLKLRKWKSPQGFSKAKQNKTAFIEEVSSFALATKNEQARVEILRTIKGVDYPVASVILHFAFPDSYSILDFRALEALKWDIPKAYTFDFWMKYTLTLRELSQKLTLPIRTIDKALWEFSKQGMNTL